MYPARQKFAIQLLFQQQSPITCPTRQNHHHHSLDLKFLGLNKVYIYIALSFNDYCFTKTIRRYILYYRKYVVTQIIFITFFNIGIVLSWNMTIPKDCVEIASYQLFAYQETSAPPSTSLWKKVNVFLLFSLDWLVNVAWSFIAGAEDT